MEIKRIEQIRDKSIAELFQYNLLRESRAYVVTLEDSPFDVAYDKPDFILLLTNITRNNKEQEESNPEIHLDLIEQSTRYKKLKKVIEEVFGWRVALRANELVFFLPGEYVPDLFGSKPLWPGAGEVYFNEEMSKEAITYVESVRFRAYELVAYITNNPILLKALLDSDKLEVSYLVTDMEVLIGRMPRKFLEELRTARTEDEIRRIIKDYVDQFISLRRSKR